MVASSLTVPKIHSCTLDAVELVFTKAVQLVLDQVATAEEVGENEREYRVAVVVHAVDIIPTLSEILFQLPKAGSVLNLRGFALGSRMTDCNSRPSARLKVFRAMTFSAGDHFRFPISVPALGVARLDRLVKFRLSPMRHFISASWP
jgi:hypothetical protein